MQGKSEAIVSRLNNYKIIEQIGEGTYGTVYRATHLAS